jgi:anti-sigma factor RsiW
MNRPDLSCREVLDFLAAYLEGELELVVRAAFERHLTLCPQCVDYLEGYRETIRLGRAAYDLDGPVPAEVPEELVEAILASRRTERA